MHRKWYGHGMMAAGVVWLLLRACVPGQDFAPGDLVVTEFMADTSHAEGDLEWFEVFNLRFDRAASLGGWYMRDDGTVRGTLGPEAVVGARQLAVLTADRDRFLADWPQVSPGIVFEWTGGFSLANTADEIYLIDPADRIIGSALYTDGDPGEQDFAVYRKYEWNSLRSSPMADWREQAGPSMWSATDPTVPNAGAGNVMDALAFRSAAGTLASPGAGQYAFLIPEPAPVALLLPAGAALALAGRARRRRR